MNVSKQTLDSVRETIVNIQKAFWKYSILIKSSVHLISPGEDSF